MRMYAYMCSIYLCTYMGVWHTHVDICISISPYIYIYVYKYIQIYVSFVHMYTCHVWPSLCLPGQAAKAAPRQSPAREAAWTELTPPRLRELRLQGVLLMMVVIAIIAIIITLVIITSAIIILLASRHIGLHLLFHPWVVGGSFKGHPKKAKALQEAILDGYLVRFLGVVWSP